MSNPTTTPKVKEEQPSHPSATGIADKAKDAASTVSGKVKDAASSVAHSAQDMASGAAQKTQDAVSSVGSGLTSLAGTIRDKGPHDGMLGTASSRVADTLERGGHYLQDEGLSGMAEDLTELIRRNPIPALLIGVGLGFLLARTLRS
jgi:hypothetical protein